VVTLLAGDDPDSLHNTLSLAGFRRSQDLAYRPACEGCNACVPVRIPVASYVPDRTQRRNLKRNRQISAQSLPSLATREHYLLFRRYVQDRHLGGGMAEMNFVSYRAMIEDTPVQSQLIEFRERGRLLGVCLSDRMDDGFSLVYSFFEPMLSHRSLGVHVILWHIQRCRDLGLSHIYLGYWIANSPKMAYKAKFKPFETLGPEGWQRQSI
jgi:arginine-tRNA-protein transferase